MATNNYFGFSHNSTPYAGASAPTGYQPSQSAYGVASTAGVTAPSNYSTQRPTGYDTSSYQGAAASVSFGGVTSTTPTSYDYTTAPYGRASSGNVGGTYDSTKNYYQQTATGQSGSQTTSVNPHIAAPSSTVGSNVSSDLQNWPAQSFSNRQTSVTPVKNVYNANYPVPVTRGLNVSQKIQSSQSSFITQQYQQQPPTSQIQQQQTIQPVVGSGPAYQLTNAQPQSALQNKVPNVGTIGQPKKLFSVPVGSTSNSPYNTVGSSSGSSSQISAAAVGYNAPSVSSYGTAYPLNTVHNVAGVAAKPKANPLSTSAASTSYAAPYDSAVINAASYYMNNQNSNLRPKFNTTGGGSYNYKPRPGFGSTPTRPFRPRVPPKPQQLHYCDACKISCAGPGAYHDHLQGQKHKKKVAKTKPESTKSQGGLPIFVCQLCDVECTAADAYAAHIRGAKHTKVVKLHCKLGKPIPPDDPRAAAAIAALNPQDEPPSKISSAVPSILSTTSNKPTSSNKPFANRPSVSVTDNNSTDIKREQRTSKEDVDIFKDDRPAVGMEYIDEEKNDVGKLVNFVCKLCDCKFSDPNAKEMHMKGRKHRLAFKKKVDPELKVEVKNNNQGRRSFIKGRGGSRRRFRTGRSDRTDTRDESKSADTDDGQSKSGESSIPKPSLKIKWTNKGPSGRGARMLAEENEQNNRLWEQEYRRYEEDLKEYRQYCRKYGASAVPPPPPGMMPRDVGFPLMRPATGSRSVIPGMPPAVRMHSQSSPPQPPPFLMGTNQPSTRESVEDKHINIRHKAICQTEYELRQINKIATIIEKSVRMVSDIMIDSSDGQQGSKSGVANEDNKTQSTGSKETKKETPGPNRILTGLHRVGALSKTLLLKGNNTVEMVLMCSVKPTLSLLNDVISHLPDQLKKSDEFDFKVTSDIPNAAIKIVVSNKNEQTEQPIVTIQIQVTSAVIREEILSKEDGSNNISEVIAEITPDPVDVLDKAKCLEALAAVRHAKWFQARALGLHNCLLVIRILKDLCERVPTWAPFNCWLMELLVERVISSSTIPLSPGDALRRVFEAISSGILLPGGSGLQDPCEKDPVDAASMLKPQEREDITASAQHALRMLAFNQIHKILGIEKLKIPVTATRRPPFKKGPRDIVRAREIANRKRRRENSAGGAENEAVDGKKDKKEKVDDNAVVQMDIADSISSVELSKPPE